MKATILILLLAVGAAGCAGTRDRLADLRDVVDLRGGAGGVGLGVKAHVTEYAGAVVGLASGYRETESFGRRTIEFRSDTFGLGAFGIDGPIGPCPGEGAEIDCLGFRLPAARPHPTSAFRIGGEVILPGVRGGFYLNPGELLDFFAGFAGADLADDDGLPRGAPLDARASERREKAAAAAAGADASQRSRKAR